MLNYLILLIALILFLGVYAFFRIRRLLCFYGADATSKKTIAASVLLAAGTAFLCLNLFRTVGILTLHAVVCSLILDIVAWPLAARFRKKEGKWAWDLTGRLYQSGILPLLLTAGAFAYGSFNMNHIQKTQYQIPTSQLTDDYRIVLLTDVHYGSVQNENVLKSTLEEINAQRPDFVILGGDIVEEGTSKEKMQEIFHLLGSLENQYGIFYIYGNHDRQPYTRQRTYTDEELSQAIHDSGIQILEDASVKIGTEIILAGRGDAAWGATKKRASVKEILNGADPNAYLIMADHQPIEAKENSGQGVDLLLSGHTHGGQIWPTGILSELMGTLNYGAYKQDGCTVIVSSGTAGWAYSIRTGAHCEYVVVDLKSK